MPAPLIAKIDRLASPAGDPPARFLDVVNTVPGLEAVHLLRSLDGAQHVGIWLWRGREGMQAGHDALAEKMHPLGPPAKIEERILDVVDVDGDVAATGATVAVMVHLGPFTTTAQREAYVANVPRVNTALRTLSGFRTSLMLSDPAGRDLLGVTFWGEMPQQDAVQAAIGAQPVPAGIDSSLLREPSYVERYQIAHSIRPAVSV
jgi:hypothetical protein